MSGSFLFCRSCHFAALKASSIVIAGSILLAGGCKSKSGQTNSVSMKPPLLAHGGSDGAPYRVGAGDILLVAPVKGGEPLRAEVSLDGTLRIPGIEPMNVDGLTCPEIEDYFSTYERVHVEVAEYKSQHILVSGIFPEKAPRPITYHGPETIENLISRIGCPECQRGYRVRVVRPSQKLGGEPQIFAEEIDVRGRREPGKEAIVIEPGDYVYVEKDLGRKGPLTLMTDSDFYAKSFGYLKRIRLAQANEELESKN